MGGPTEVHPALAKQEVADPNPKEQVERGTQETRRQWRRRAEWPGRSNQQEEE